MNYLQKYYNYLIKNNKEPDWKLYVNPSGNIDSYNLGLNGSNFFKVKDYWYIFEKFKEKSSSSANNFKTGLFRVKFNSNKYELVMDENATHISDDPMAKILNKDFLKTKTSISAFTYKNIHFLYSFDSSSKKHNFFAIVNSSDGLKSVDISNCLKNSINSSDYLRKMYVMDGKINITDSDSKKHTIDLQNVESLKDYLNPTKTLRSLWIETLLKRLEVGTYMYKENPGGTKYKDLALRKEFNRIKSEIENFIKENNNSNTQKIEEYYNKLDEIVKKISS
ncbi:Uncharacterised protein [Metamycoplasma arthritidis]|nr:Uncharacterised protein [Metamycoplasma arthritidis]